MGKILQLLFVHATEWGWEAHKVHWIFDGTQFDQKAMTSIF